MDKLLGRFAGLSGLKINTDKTFILLLGPHTNKDDKLPSGADGKHFGNFFSSDDMESQERINYKEILSKIKKLLTWWKQRDLTLMGKIQMIKTFVLSKLVYVSVYTDTGTIMGL